MGDVVEELTEAKRAFRMLAIEVVSELKEDQLSVETEDPVVSFSVFQMDDG